MSSEDIATLQFYLSSSRVLSLREILCLKNIRRIRGASWANTSTMVFDATCTSPGLNEKVLMISRLEKLEGIRLSLRISRRLVATHSRVALVKLTRRNFLIEVITQRNAVFIGFGLETRSSGESYFFWGVSLDNWCY